MTFLAILICWGLLQLLGYGGPVQRDQWLRGWAQQFATLGLPTHLQWPLIVGLPLVIVALILDLVDGIWLGVFTLLLYTAVLAYSLGRGDFSRQLQDYLNSWLRGDTVAAVERAHHFSDYQEPAQLESAEQLHHSVRKAVLYQGFERWFVVVFWFALLGPLAALAYRLCYLLSRQPDRSAQERETLDAVLYGLEWLPARLLVISFALAGRFDPVMSYLRRVVLQANSSRDLLDEAAQQAVGGGAVPADELGYRSFAATELNTLHGLMSRSVLIWFAAIAILQML